MILFHKLWRFLLNPKYQSYAYPSPLKRKLFLNLLFLNLFIAMAIGTAVGFLVEVLALDVGQNAIVKMLDNYSPVMILFLAVILAPVLEETIFRGPLYFFRKSPYFSIALYGSIFLFGLLHLFNYDAFENVLWIAPLLFLPQLITGIFLSYIRISMGLMFAILYHGLFNLIIIGPFILMQLLNFPISEP